jgi:hypothetical protein
MIDNLVRFAIHSVRQIDVLKNVNYILYRIPIKYDKDGMGDIESISPSGDFLEVIYRKKKICKESLEVQKGFSDYS